MRLGRRTGSPSPTVSYMVAQMVPLAFLDQVQCYRSFCWSAWCQQVEECVGDHGSMMIRTRS